MAENRRGLGRGLSALLGDAETPQAPGQEGVSEGVREAPVELIRRNESQPRFVFPEAEMEELTLSVRDKGVLQPILVRPTASGPEAYEIVAGERRWRAAQRAGLHSVPVIVRELDDQQVLEIAVIENVQRADLNAIEEANAYKQLMDRFSHTQEAVAEAVGKSRSHVANVLRLLTLPKAVQTYVLEGRLSAGHARAIISAPDPEALAELIIAHGLNVREAEAMARKGPVKDKAAPAARKPEKDADTRALEGDLSDSLGLDVEVLDRGGVGELRIRYQTLEQLDDLCRRLTRA